MKDRDNADRRGHSYDSNIIARLLVVIVKLSNFGSDFPHFPTLQTVKFLVLQCCPVDFVNTGHTRVKLTDAVVGIAKAMDTVR
jgi:hypothetical protein